MKQSLAIALLFAFLGSSEAAPPKSTKSLKPWRSVPVSELRIMAERTTDDMKNQEVVVYGNGVAIWNNSVQFRLGPDDLKKILAAFDASGFGTIPTTREGEHLRRRVGIQAGNYSREVVETWEDEQEREEGDRLKKQRPATERERDIKKKKTEQQRSRALEKLTDSIFAIVSPVEEKGGPEAASLREGLKKVASGELAPETLSLMVLIKPELGGSDPGDGFLMRIEDGGASVSRYASETFTPPTRVKVSASTIQEIASRLLSFDPETLPVNLYASNYQEFTVSVLNRRKNVLARQFAGLTPEKHGEAQKRYTSMVTWLDQTRGSLFGQSPASR